MIGAAAMTPKFNLVILRRESKESRARFAAARYEAGVVYHRRDEPWRADLEAELETFPAGYKDQAGVVADCVTAVEMAAEKDGSAYGAASVDPVPFSAESASGSACGRRCERFQNKAVAAAGAVATRSPPF